MGRSAAAFFSWVQGADFYRALHAAAVDLAADGVDGRIWLDVGTGPGLVARLAAERGFEATGIDTDPAMVATARRAGGATFDVGSLDDLGTARADVVSATSLLAAVPDPAAAVRALWRAVRPGGALLVVETTSRMRPGATREVHRPLTRRDRSVLAAWCHARRGRTISDPSTITVPGVIWDSHDVFDGLVAAHIARSMRA